jgi:CBS domain-containing protein
MHVTVLLLRRSILTEKIARRGQHIMREYGIDLFELTRAADIMVHPVDTLPGTMTIGAACDFFSTVGKTHRLYPVVEDDGTLVGVVSRADVLRWRGDKELADQNLTDRVSDTSAPVGHPDDTVGFVADLMLAAETGRVPIVDPASGKLVGLIARKDLLRLRSALQSSEQDRRPYLGAQSASETTTE